MLAYYWFGYRIGSKLQESANQKIVNALSLKFDRARRDSAAALREVAATSQIRINRAFDEIISGSTLTDLEQEARSTALNDLSNGNWKRTFPGRDILTRFVDIHVDGIDYLRFRNLIIAKMRSQGFQPPGMKEVINAIMSDEQDRRSI